MWSASLGDTERHLYGQGENHKVHSLCGLEGKLPLEYLRFDLCHCAECFRRSGIWHEQKKTKVIKVVKI